MALCSIVIPVFGQSALTAQCLNAILARPPRADFELVVVDDGSSDATEELLAGYGDRIRVIRHERNLGFAISCNEGAALGTGRYIVFLNNDTIPQAGWLDSLIRYAERNPAAAVVGAKLLFPDDTIQHAGVIVTRERFMRHVYAGFPADHPAVDRSRRFQIVTAACALFRREAFEEAGGFDTAFVNSHEDIDLCLRLGELGHEVHYCHESVLYHLESASEGRFDHVDRNEELYLERWAAKVKPDDMRYYLEDGLVALRYPGPYQVELAVSPLLGSVLGERARHAELFLSQRARQTFELLQEAERLRARAQAAELRAGAANGSRPPTASAPPRLLLEPELRWLAEEPSGPVVSVLFPLGAGLEQLLASLHGQRAEVCLELLALGAGAGGESLELLRGCGAGLLAFDERAPFSLARARSLAAGHARGELVVLLGADVVPAGEEWLSALLAPLLRAQEPSVVFGRLLPAPEADPLSRRALAAAAGGQRFQSRSAALPAELLRRLPPPVEGGDAGWAGQLLAAGVSLLQEPSSLALVLPADPLPGLLAGAEAAGLERLREDWRFLEQECELAPAELEEWRLRAALLRAGQLLEQAEDGGVAGEASPADTVEAI